MLIHLALGPHWGIHTPDYSSWVVWSCNRVKDQKKNEIFQLLGIVSKTLISLAQYWLKVYRDATKQDSLYLLTSLKYLGEPTQIAFSISSTLLVFTCWVIKVQLTCLPQSDSHSRRHHGLSLGCLNLALEQVSQARGPITADCSSCGQCSFYFAQPAFQERVFFRGFCQRRVWGMLSRQCTHGQREQGMAVNQIFSFPHA